VSYYNLRRQALSLEEVTTLVTGAGSVDLADKVIDGYLLDAPPSLSAQSVLALVDLASDDQANSIILSRFRMMKDPTFDDYLAFSMATTTESAADELSEAVSDLTLIDLSVDQIRSALDHIYSPESINAFLKRAIRVDRKTPLTVSEIKILLEIPDDDADITDYILATAVYPRLDQFTADEIIGIAATAAYEGAQDKLLEAYADRDNLSDDDVLKLAGATAGDDSQGRIIINTLENHSGARSVDSAIRLANEGTLYEEDQDDALVKFAKAQKNRIGGQGLVQLAQAVATGDETEAEILALIP
jgi:hypothetical protein